MSATLIPATGSASGDRWYCNHCPASTQYLRVVLLHILTVHDIMSHHFPGLPGPHVAASCCTQAIDSGGRKPQHNPTDRPHEKRLDRYLSSDTAPTSYTFHSRHTLDRAFRRRKRYRTDITGKTIPGLENPRKAEGSLDVASRRLIQELKNENLRLRLMIKSDVVTADLINPGGMSQVLSHACDP